MVDKNNPNNPIFEQYVREYQRLIQVFRRMKKAGYIIPDEIKPLSPTKVKTLTQSDVESLIKLTPKKVREQSYYVDPISGEAIHGLDVIKSHHKAKQSVQKARVPQGRKTDKQQETESPNKTKRKQKKHSQNQKSNEGEAPPKENNLNMQIVEDISRMIDTWEPKPAWPPPYKLHKITCHITLKDAWLFVLNMEGEYEVAYRLENKAQYYHDLIGRVLYGSDSPMEDKINVSEVVSFLLGRPLTQEESDHYSSEAYDYLTDVLMGDSFG